MIDLAPIAYGVLFVVLTLLILRLRARALRKDRP